MISLSYLDNFFNCKPICMLPLALKENLLVSWKNESMTRLLHLSPKSKGMDGIKTRLTTGSFLKRISWVVLSLTCTRNHYPMDRNLVDTYSPLTRQ